MSNDARVVRKGNIEVRLHSDGTLDEVVVYGPDGQCWYHLEQMNDAVFWMRFYGDGQDLVSTSGPVVRVDWEWD